MRGGGGGGVNRKDLNSTPHPPPPPYHWFNSSPPTNWTRPSLPSPTQYQFTEKSNFWVLKNLTASTLMWKKIVRPKLSVGFLPLLEMSLKMDQLCGMQAAIQLHQMARNSVFKKVAFSMFIWNFDALNTLKNFGAMNSLHFFGAMNSLL